MIRKSIRNLPLTLVLLMFLGSMSTASAMGGDLGVGSTSLGNIVVDGKGMTAYFYDPDVPNSGVSSCTGPCLVHWPAITSAGSTPVVSGIAATVTLIASTNQLEINGRPIYTFIGDKSPGDTHGQGVGGIWYVVSPGGIELTTAELAKEAQATVATKTPPATPKPKPSKVATKAKTKAKAKTVHKTAAKHKKSSTYSHSNY